MAPDAVAQAPTRVRFKVFIDYWNLQLTINQKAGGARFKFDWVKLGGVLAAKAAEVVGIVPANVAYEGVMVYSSFNPKTEEGKRFKSWSQTWLDRQPGVDVRIFERRPKAPPKCPTCHKPVTICPHAGCGKPFNGTVEKGVDTHIATDMIKLAWEGAYDVAVLASSDSDLVPAVSFLGEKGKKVIQAGFPPQGVDLATSSWGSFDVWKIRSEIERKLKT